MDRTSPKANVRRFGGWGFCANSSARNWMMLPKIQEFINLGWQRHIPPDAGMLFFSLAFLEFVGCDAEQQAHWLRTWYDMASNRVVTEEQACVQEDAERRFNAEYGKPWSRTLEGLLGLLADLGLIVAEQGESGMVWYRTAEILPAPEERLSLSEAEKRLLQKHRRPCFEAIGEEGDTVQ